MRLGKHFKQTVFGKIGNEKSILARQSEMQLRQQRRKMNMIRGGILSNTNRNSHNGGTQTSL